MAPVRTYIASRQLEEQIVLKTTEVSSQHYRDAMARFAGAVHIVTTDGAAGRRGVTAIAACSVSDDPPTVLVCLNRQNPSNDLFVKNGVFALNTLSSRHEELSKAFAGLTKHSYEERFGLAEWETIVTGAPILPGALAVFDCKIVKTVELGTHRVYFGHVTGLRIGENLQPLLYHERGYRVL
ncbi:flavin reductase-like, FMN-binding protein [Nitratireductor indicus C115]|uniref:Flavin reductase-like, FMN-binding protein n=2 Tax=Nitratireductor indicus TaxID=721133 RepID=K2NTY3_9HYPH|nr:flavin reductase-like, FMN-binding protein [Nitratireductor indicus C115]